MEVGDDDDDRWRRGVVGGVAIARVSLAGTSASTFLRSPCEYAKNRRTISQLSGYLPTKVRTKSRNGVYVLGQRFGCQDGSMMANAPTAHCVKNLSDLFLS